METERFVVHRMNRKRRASGDESGEGFLRKGAGSVRDEAGKGEVTFSGDRPTNRDIIESKIFMYFYYIPLASLIDFPSLCVFLSSLDSTSISHLLSIYRVGERVACISRLSLRMGLDRNLCRCNVENIRCNLCEINIVLKLLHSSFIFEKKN